jgi:hypothetical protein
MQDRFGASILEGRGYIVVLAALGASLLSVVVGALAGVALAQGEGGGDVNIDASDCSQVQAIFIQQFLDDDDDDDGDTTTTVGTTTVGTTNATAASEQFDEAAAEISQQIGISQTQVLICLKGLVAVGTTTVGTTNGGTTTVGTTTVGTTTVGTTTVGTTNGGDQEKVTLCHAGTETITVDVSALETHLAHGDSVGTCEQADATTPDQTTGETTATTTDATTTGGDGISTTPEGEVITATIPKKQLPDTGGVAVLAPALALLISGAAVVGVLLARRR